MKKKIKISKRKFYRNIVTIEVLSEEKPLKDVNLEDISYETNFGEWLGGTIKIKSEKVDAKKMVKLLESNGSDSTFFQLDENGADDNPVI